MKMTAAMPLSIEAMASRRAGAGALPPPIASAIQRSPGHRRPRTRRAAAFFGVAGDAFTPPGSAGITLRAAERFR